MGIEADCISVVQTTISKLSGLDIIISNAGYTRFSTFSDLTAPTAQDWDLCHAVNVKAQFFLMREAAPTFKKNPEGGVFVITSSIAGVTAGGSSMRTYGLESSLPFWGFSVRGFGFGKCGVDGYQRGINADLLSGTWMYSL